MAIITRQTSRGGSEKPDFGVSGTNRVTKLIVAFAAFRIDG
jgi:hypothetical protein